MAESGTYNTAGQPNMVRVCYCGTTGCINLGDNDYPLPKDYKKVVELTQEEEKRFYDKVMRTTLLPTPLTSNEDKQYDDKCKDRI